MRTLNRSYSEESGDFNAISNFIIKESKDLRFYSTWSLGRFVDWKYGLYSNRTAVAGFWENNAELWFDGFNNLVAVALSENGDAGIAILTATGYRFLFKDIMEWIIKNWSDRSGNFYMEITENQDLEKKILNDLGFKKGQDFITRSFDLDKYDFKKTKLKSGYSIIDMSNNKEYKEQRILRDNAFDGIKDLSDEEFNKRFDFYSYNQKSPIYHPYTDLVVKSDKGIHVSGCEALIDAWNSSCDIERICTHSDYRQQGFARAVINECFLRLKEIGIKKAYILGYSDEAISLYGSMGHTGESKGAVYYKEK